MAEVKEMQGGDWSIDEPERKPFQPAPEGIWEAVCCDVPRPVEREYKDEVQWKTYLVFQIEKEMEDGKRFICRTKPLTPSTHERSNLGKLLRKWSVDPKDVKEIGFKTSLIGRTARLTIEHSEPTDDGTIYANIISIKASGNSMEVTDDYVPIDERDNDSFPG